MKKPVIIVLILITILNRGFTADIMQKLEKEYPGISFHINLVKKTDPELASEANLTRLYSYVQNSNTSIQKGMALVLNRELYTRIQKANSVRFTIDGKADEWDAVPFSETDPEGDGIQGVQGGDMVWMKAFIDADDTLYMVMKPAEKPDPELIFQPLLYFNQTKTWEVQVLVSKTLKMVNEQIDGKRYPKSIHGFDAAAGNVYEVKLPLKEFLQTRDDLEFVHIWTGFFYNDNYDAMSMRVNPCNKNYAFLLLLYLVHENCFKAGDAITFSLAYANNVLYSMADKQTKAAIKADVKEHYLLYNEINTWQKNMNLPYALESIPVIPKICWSARHNKSDQLYLVREAMNSLSLTKMNLEIYREFIDRVDLLHKIYNHLIRKNVFMEKNIIAAAGNVEKSLYPVYEVRYALWKYEDLYKRGLIPEEEYNKILNEAKTDYEKEYFGITRNWEEFRWNNYQFYNRYFKGKKIMGDCGTATQAQLVLYKMAGICPVSCQRINLTATFDYPATHNFPAFYNPVIKRWSFIQIPSTADKRYKAGKKLSFSFNIPYMHHTTFDIKKSLCEDITTSERTVNFHHLGFGEKEFDTIFINQNTPGLQGALFTKQNAPKGTPVDDDADGLFNIIEKDLHTNPKAIDSDSDGFSDFWEVYNDYDPLNKGIPGKEMAAIDGLLNSYEKKECLFTKDPKGDQPDGNKAGDIIKMGSFCNDTTLYIMAEVAAPIERDIIFQPLLYINGETDWSIQILVSGNTQFVKERTGETMELKIIRGFAYGIGEIYEVLLPLSPFLKNGEPLEKLRTWTGVFAGDNYDACSFYIIGE